MTAQPDWLSNVSKGDMEFSRRHYSVAQEYFEEAVRQAPQHRIPHERLGNFYYFSGRLDAALKHLFRAFELGSGEPLVFFNLGRIYFLGAELLDRGRYFLDRVLALSPKNEPLVGTYLGALFYLKGRADEAAELLSRLRLATPLKEPLEFFLGCSYHDLGSYAIAERHFKHALSLEERNEESLVVLGNTEFRQKKYEEALAHFKQAMEFNPEYAPAWQNAAVALQFLGKPAEAAENMKKSLTLRRAGQSAREKRGSVEEPGLERHVWMHVERLLLEGTVFRGGNPIHLD